MTRTLAGWRSRIEGLSQRTRRLVVVAAIAGLPGGLAWSAMWHTTSAPSYLWGPLLILFGAATGFGALVLYTYVRDRANRDARLDERERQLRDRAWVLCYEFLSAVVVAVVLFLGIFVLGFGRPLTLDWLAVTDIAIVTGSSYRCCRSPRWRGSSQMHRRRRDGADCPAH